MTFPASSPRSRPSRRPGSVATRLALLVAAVALAATFLDYGITWDESVQSTYGELALEYFLSRGADQRCHQYLDLRYYGALFETALAAAYRGVPQWKFEIRHAATAVTAWLTLLATARFARRMGGPGLPALAVVALALMPRFVGHAADNSKDVPFACGFAWGMLGIARLLAARDWRWADALLCGAAIGLALAVRVGAVLLLVLLGLGLALGAGLDREQRLAWIHHGRRRALQLLALAAVAWGVMVAGWPWSHGAPVARPLAALRHMADFSHGYTTLFEGRWQNSADLPRTYVPKYLAITTPAGLLALAAIGTARLAGRVRRERAEDATPVRLALLWLLVPVAYAVVQRPNVYDGVRHFLFVLPAIALVAASGAEALLAGAGPRRWVVASTLLLAAAVPVTDMVALHPYQSSYFNALSGGTRGAWGRYEMDYWLGSYREAARWIVEDAWGRPGEETVIVVACNDNNRACIEHDLQTRVERWMPSTVPDGAARPRISMSCVWKRDDPLPRDADYYVATLRYGKASAFFADWPVVHRVERSGATFSLIRRNPRGVPARDVR